MSTQPTRSQSMPEMLPARTEAVRVVSPGQTGRSVRGRLQRVIVGVLVALVFFVLYLPPAIMAMFSFGSKKVQTLPLGDFTLDWYAKLMSNDTLLSALGYSLRVSLTAVLIALVLGTLFALILWRPFRSSRVWQGLLALPMLLPGMVLGVSLLLTFKILGIERGFLSLVIGHAVFIVPVIVFVVGQRLNSLDPTLLHASRDLGATPWRAFWSVTFPLLRTALLAGGLLGLTLSFDELAASFFISGFEQTLPVSVWGMLRLGFDPQVNAVFTLLLIVSILVVFIAYRLMRRQLKAAARRD
ncbi:MAG: ABC transporter permease [Candidatus Leucobacter sulfamidivorax]|nr:ABC transporter permease [Candidatus Leucobacter sulfamidivorax]